MDFFCCKKAEKNLHKSNICRNFADDIPLMSLGTWDLSLHPIIAGIDYYLLTILLTKFFFIMKKFLFIMTLLIAFCVPWAHGQTLLYEGFESTSGTALPSGWTNEGDKTWTTALGVNGTYPSSAYAGSRNAQLYSADYDVVTKLITPVIDCSSKSSVILTFAYVNQSFTGDIDEIRVYYRISTADSWHQLDNITSEHSTWTLSEEYTIPTSLSSTLQLAFECYSHWGRGAGIDEVKVVPMPTCFKPTGLNASNVTATSADISWTASGHGESKYQYVVVASGTTPDWSNAVDVTSTECTVTGLTPNTNYDVYVRSYCDDSDQSDGAKVTFRTACSVIADADLPYFEDFDSYTSGPTYSIDACWKKGTNYSYTAYPYPYSSCHYGTTGNSLYFAGSSSSNYYSYAALPKFASDINKLQLNFKMYVSTAYYPIEVGVMTDPTDYSTFTRFGEAILAGSTSTWVDKEIFFDSYAGSDGYIAFRCPATGSSYVYIDNVMVSKIPSCKPVQSVSVNNIERISFDVTWTPKAGVTNCEGYEVVVSDSELDATALESATKHTVTDGSNTYHAADLERNTQYYIYVRSNCGDGDGYSEWISTEAKTNDLSVCDKTIGNGTAVLSGIPTISSYGNTYSQQIFTAEELEAAGIIPGKITGMSYTWNQASSSIKDFSIYIGSTTKEVFESSTDWVNASGFSLNYNDPNMVVTGAGTVNYMFTTPFVWDGESNIVIVTLVNQTSQSAGSTGFQSIGISGTTNRSMYMRKDNTPYSVTAGSSTGTLSTSRSNITFCQLVDACPAVTNVAVSNIAQTTANLSWTASTGDYANTYDVLVSTTPVGSFAHLVPTYVNLDTCGLALTDLEQYTDYYVYVRVKCNAREHSDGEAWSEAVQFKTLSNCIVPTDFAVTILTKTSAKAQWTVTSQASNYRYILSTEVLENPDTVALTGHDIHSDNTLLNRLTPGETYYLYLSNACGGEDGNSPYISTSFTMPEACFAPTEMNITDVQKYQMTLNWTPSQYAEDGDAYDIYVSNAEVLDFTSVEPTYTGVTGTSKVIDLLQRNTTYYIYMRGNCGEGAVTDWSAAVSESTLGNAPDCDKLVVANGTTTNTYVPVFGSAGGQSEFIYPASMLTDMIGKPISSVKFYATSAPSLSKNITVKLEEVSAATASSSSWRYSSSATTVYTGNVSLSSNKEMEIVFSEPFIYNGGNLCFNICAPGTSSSVTWYGQNMSSSIASAYDFYIDPPVPSPYSIADFLPKASFAYCVTAPLCPAVDAPVATDVTNNSATISWNAGTGDFATSYDLIVSDTVVTDFTGAALAADDVTETSFDVTGLAANTHYYTYVRVNCVNEIYDDGSSVWSPAGEFTTELACLKPENFVAGSPLSDRVELSWIKKGTAVDWKIAVDTVDHSIWDFVHADTIDVNIAACTVVEDTVTYLLTGLEPNKQYQLHLLADCGEVDSLSKFATNTPSFTTFSNNTEIDTMVISSAEVFSTVIDRAAKTIDFVVRKGSDLEAMDGSISLNHSGAQVRVNGEAFVAPWNLSAPVTVTVLAQDTTISADWTITVAEEACATPYDVAATDIERRTANLVWNIGDASTSFDVIISETELSKAELADTTVESVTVTNVDGACTYAITGLTRETHYYVYVRTNCGETFGQWRGTDFTTKALSYCENVTICDGTATNDAIPYYGYDYDGSYDKSQFIYPDEMMAALRGQAIKKMTFFTSTSSKAHNGKIEVRIGVTSANNLSEGYEDAPEQIVYSGSLTVSNYKWEIDFGANTYQYPSEGGNLLIQVKKTANGTYGRDYFYGTDDNGISRMTNGGSDATYTFLPKVTFEACVHNEACPEVTNVAIDNIAETSATVTWTESTGDYANTSDIYYSTTEVEDFTGVEPQVTGATGNSAQITDLANYTTYYVYVRTHCDGEGQDDGISNWAGGTSFRTLSPCRVPGTPEATITGKHTATVAWTNTSEATQADNFTYILSATPIAEADLETASATASAYNDTTVDLTDLLSDTTYYFYVRNVCTGDVNCNSPWDSCQFPMPAALPAVINLQTYDIASNAFSAVWESDLANFADETAWEVACVEDGETPATWTEVSAREYFAIGLTPSTDYDFYVRATDGENYSANAKVDVATTAVPADCKTIGDGTGSSGDLPCNGYYNNAYGQQIFDASELQAGQISSIAFQYGSTNAMTSTQVKIYLGHTSKSEFTSGDDWIAAADLTEVYSGSFYCSGDGVFNTFTLTTPFDYNGTDNLVVAVHKENNTGCESNSRPFRYSYCSGSKSIYFRNDGTACPVTSPASGTLGSFRTNIEFCFAPQACPSVTNLVVDNITTTSARAHWYPGAAETEWHVYNTTEQMTADDLALLEATDYATLSNPQIALTDLTKDMDYYFYVRGNCGEGETSRWKEAHYITLPSCSAPATAVATSEADNSITFTVTAGEYGTAEDFIYEFWTVGGTDNVDRLLQGCGECHEISIGGLDTIICEPPCRAHRDTVVISGGNSVTVMVDPLKTYGWRVRANCGDPDDLSRWTYGNEVHVCGAATLPYSDDFKTLPTSSYSGPGMIETICWNDLNAAAEGSYPSYSINPASTDGTYAIQFNSSNVTPIYMILPAIKDANECQVRFDCGYGSISYSGRIQVGYITDPTDETTFVPAFTDNPTSASYRSHRVNIFNIPDGARVAFCYTAGAYTNYNGLLKNVVLDTIPHYNVATSVAPVVTPAIGSVEVAYNEGDTLSEGVFFDATTPVFTAVPNEGIEFINWTNANNGDTLATVNPWTITVSQDTAIVANFDTASYNLNVLVAPGYDILGEVAGSGNYRYGRTINYSATPMEHYSVVWPDGNKENNRSIVMPGHDTTIVATFEIDKHQLTVAMNDSSKGTVTGTGVYDYGTFVDITAAPIDPVHMIFTGWSNGETDANITIDLQHDSTVVANFIWDEHTVSTNVNDPTMGSVTGAGIYTHDDVARLIATPTDHHIFVEWSNGLTNDTIDITVVSDTALTATFDWDSHDITVLKNVDSMGVVTGAGNYYHGTPVTLTAVPAEHHHFVDWSTGETTTSITIVANDDTTITANFAIDQHTITAIPVDTVRGKVEGSGVYNYGDTATLIAVGKYPYEFSRWDDENLTELDTFKVKVLGDATYTAYFKYNEFDVIARSADLTMGTVVGGGAFVYDTVVNVTAIPNEHYHFDHWNNGSVDPTTTVIVKFDTVLTAYFAIDQHVVRADVNNNALGSVAGAGTYNYGDEVTLTATPAAHAVFTGWSNGLTDATITITVAGDTTVTAMFAADTHTIAATADPTMGNVTGAGEYVHGTLATLVATANEHYHFVNWSNGLTVNTFSILVDKDSTVVANFAIDQHVVTANVNNNALGTVAGAGTYNYGASATLTATPAAHAVFTGWSNGATTATINITVAGDTTVTAMFAADSHTIAATADPAMGSVSGAGTYTHGTLATLVATANEHYHFVNWSNGLTVNTFSILVDKDSTVVANFAIDQHVVTANVNNYDYGTVAGAGTYNYGAQVTLTATPAAHSVFTGWSNGATANPYTFTLAGDTTVTAMFAADVHTIAATADPTMGNVTGAGEYVHGTLATLTATANEHYHFVNWSNGLTVNTFSILVDKDSTVVANFAIDQHVVTANANNYDYGTVAGAGAYDYGASVTLTATAAPHYMFTGWSDGTTANPYTFTLEGDVNVTAIFSFADPITEYIYVTYCDNETEGTKFEGYSAGVYDIVNTYITATGRDSIVDSVITILPTYNLSEYETIEVGKSLVWHGMTIVEATDGDYTYVDSAKTAAGCDSVTTLYLHVTAKTDVEVISDVKMPIIVAPNPIVTGMTTYVNHDWSEEEREGMFVEIIDNFGKVIDHFTPENFPIEVRGDMASGIYHIRVVTGTQDVYVEKLIVE